MVICRLFTTEIKLALAKSDIPLLRCHPIHQTSKSSLLPRNAGPLAMIYVWISQILVLMSMGR